jgi:hypothetical protein
MCVHEDIQYKQSQSLDGVWLHLAWHFLVKSKEQILLPPYNGTWKHNIYLHKILEISAKNYEQYQEETADW